MKLTKAKLQQLIKEELDEIPGLGGGPPIQNPADPQFSLKSDLESAETRASDREVSRDILLKAMREIEQIARDNSSPGEPGYEEILDVIIRTSPDHETDEDDY